MRSRSEAHWLLLAAARVCVCVCVCVCVFYKASLSTSFYNTPQIPCNNIYLSFTAACHHTHTHTHTDACELWDVNCDSHSAAAASVINKSQEPIEQLTLIGQTSASLQRIEDACMQCRWASTHTHTHTHGLFTGWTHSVTLMKIFTESQRNRSAVCSSDDTNSWSEQTLELIQKHTHTHTHTHTHNTHTHTHTHTTVQLV